jgi:hypothetical protein
MQRYENVVKKIVCIITTFKKINLDHNYSTIYNFLVVKQFVMKINCLCKIKKKKKKKKKRKKKKKKKNRANTQIKNTRIYVVRQYTYIHERRQEESFIKKIGRLQQWYQDSLKESKPQLHPNLSHTKNRPRENPSLSILMLRLCTHTLFAAVHGIYILIKVS